MTQTKDVKTGIYKHYKGNFYAVLGVGRNSETLEEYVVYMALYESKDFGKNAIWIRPKEMFLETVVYQDKNLPRFEFIR
ncbi:MAG TPA: DUF1653 domain-containing protein [Candidatus Woesearchaeota archaeon]|jgi:hypothetical protein|nr:DUF1653 domain-containing protein [Candidatus Woesearchaeota archaeon]